MPSAARQGDFILDPRKITALICANRSGKTEAGAIKFLRILNDSHESGRAWVCSESFDLQKTGAQEKILEYLKPEDITHIEYLKGDAIKQIDYVNPHGCKIKIEFKSYEQGVRKLQSAKLLAAWLDEEPPEDIYDEIYIRTVDKGGQLILTFTPLKGLTWSYERIFASREAHIGSYNWGMADNPFIPTNEIENLKKTLTVKKAAMRLYGKYQGSELQIYYVFDREKQIKPKLANRELPVEICIDWGIIITCVGIWQEAEEWSRIGSTERRYNLIDAKEYTGMGYGQVIVAIMQLGYMINPEGWYCDPAGRARSQSNKTGKSLLSLIKEEFGIRFKYIIHQSVEEGIELVQAHCMNATGQTRFFIQEGIFLDKDQTATPEKRIEGYIRDEKTQNPIKDGINDHFNDMIRYYITNKARGNRGGVVQH